MQLLLLLLLVPRAIARPLTDDNVRPRVSVASLEEAFGPVETWDVSQVTDMSSMFHDAYAFNGDVSKWDVSQVTDIGSMFQKAYAFNGDVSKWDVSQVTNMSYMFFDADAFNGDVSKWDVSQVRNMRSIFAAADAFNGDLSFWTKCPLPTHFGPPCQQCPFTGPDAIIRILTLPFVMVIGLAILYKSFGHDHEDHELIMDEDNVTERMANVVWFTNG
eukprot:g4829.t1